MQGIMDPILNNYLERSLDVLVTAGSYAIEDRATRPLRESLVMMRATLRFLGGSYLSVQMRVSIDGNRPSLVRYSFHYMTAESETIFRYDNSDHHEGLLNFPHHKHIGASERVIDCPQPSVGQIRNEIAAYLEGIE